MDVTNGVQIRNIVHVKYSALFATLKSVLFITIRKTHDLYDVQDQSSIVLCFLKWTTSILLFASLWDEYWRQQLHAGAAALICGGTHNTHHQLSNSDSVVSAFNNNKKRETKFSSEFGTTTIHLTVSEYFLNVLSTESEVPWCVTCTSKQWRLCRAYETRLLLFPWNR